MQKQVAKTNAKQRTLKSPSKKNSSPKTRLLSAVNSAPKELSTEQSELADFLLSFAGCLHGLPKDLAANHDKYLHGSGKK